MKKLRIELLTIVALPLAGCVPMEQASLVYSSKADIGVGIAAGTPENPGLDVHLGYKAVDVAFVPVAVAKHCAAPANCSDIDYNVKPLNGTNTVAGSSAADQQAIRNLEQSIVSRDTQIEGNSRRITALEGQIALLERLDTNRTRLGQLTAIDPATSAARTLSSDEDAEKTRIEKEITDAGKLGARADIEKERDSLSAENKKLTAENGKARENLMVKYGMMDKQTNDTKADAYSVYGTFTGGANGGNQGGALTGGKLFSTGIASQNLTQGIREASRADAMARCLDAASELLASPAMQGEARAKDRERISTMCSLTVRDD